MGNYQLSIQSHGSTSLEPSHMHLHSSGILTTRAQHVDALQLVGGQAVQDRGQREIVAIADAGGERNP